MSRVWTIARVLIAVGLFAALGLLTACATSPAESQPAGDSSTEAAPAAVPTMKLVRPTAGAEVDSGEVEVAVETTGLKFVMPSNTLVAGEGHVHFTLDDNPLVMSTEPSTVLKDVAPGPHRLVAELVQNDTTEFSPPIKQEIEFVAK